MAKKTLHDMVMGSRKRVGWSFRGREQFGYQNSSFVDRDQRQQYVVREQTGAGQFSDFIVQMCDVIPLPTARKHGADHWQIGHDNRESFCPINLHGFLVFQNGIIDCEMSVRAAMLFPFFQILE